MRSLKLALMAELELGCLWTLLLLESPDVELATLALFVFIYPFHLALMVASIVYIWKKPETRPLATAVLLTPIALLVLPGVIRTMAGGGLVAVHPAWWLTFGGLPLGACLFLPHQVAPFLPKWTLRSRWLNVSVIVLLGAMVVPWVIFLLLLVAGPLLEPLAGSTANSSHELIDAEPFLLAALVFAALSTLVAGMTFLTSYIGLFQRTDRTQHRLRVAQLILSLVVLLPSLPVVAITLGFLSLVLVNPG